MFFPVLTTYLPSPSSAHIYVLILLLCLVFGWYYWRYIRAYRYFPSKRVDIKWLVKMMTGRLPRNIPLTSFVLQELVEQANTFQAEGLCVLWFLRPYVIIYKEEFMKTLVNEVALADKASPYDLNEPFIGNGLLGSKHEIWKADRKMLDPAFKLSALKGKMQILNEHALRLVDKFEASMDKPIDVWEFLKRSAFQIMTECVLDLKLNIKRLEILSEKCLQAVDSALENFIDIIFRPWLHWKFLLPYFHSGKKYLETVDDATRHLRSVMKELLKNIILDEREDEERINKSASSILLNHYLQNPDFTEKDVRDHIVGMAVGGYETIAVTMMWCFYLLGHHPEVQEKAYNEVKSVVPEGDLTYDDLSKLKYLECIIKETLRLYTTVPVYARKASKDIQCGKYTIPKGAEVVFFIYMLHRNPEIYTDPKKFLPERFSDSSKIRPWMYIPFAEGYRGCLGKRLSMMEMKVLLSHVLRRFRITSLSKIDDSELDWAVVLKPTTLPLFSFEFRQS